MASATQIATRLFEITGLRSTGTEYTLVWQALQDAYNDAVMRTDAFASSSATTFTSSTYVYDSSSVGLASATRIRSITFSDGAGGGYPLNRVGEDEFNSLVDGFDSHAFSRVFCTLGWNKIGFWPQPSVNDQVTVRFTPFASTLIESTATAGAGEEKSPSMIPAAFHWSVLLPGAVIHCLDKDQRLEDSRVWAERYELGLQRLKEFVELYGGDTANVWVPGGSNSVSLYPDQRR